MFRRNPNLVAASIDDELVMMSIERGQYFGLTGIGPQLWEMLAQPVEIDALVESICKEYDIDAETCKTDVDEFIDSLEKLELVERL